MPPLSSSTVADATKTRIYVEQHERVVKKRKAPPTDAKSSDGPATKKPTVRRSERLGKKRKASPIDDAVSSDRAVKQKTTFGDKNKTSHKNQASQTDPYQQISSDVMDKLRETMGRVGELERQYKTLSTSPRSKPVTRKAPPYIQKTLGPLTEEDKKTLSGLRGRHFLNVNDFSTEETLAILKLMSIVAVDYLNGKSPDDLDKKLCEGCVHIFMSIKAGALRTLISSSVMPSYAGGQAIPISGDMTRPTVLRGDPNSRPYIDQIVENTNLSMKGLLRGWPSDLSDEQITYLGLDPACKSPKDILSIRSLGIENITNEKGKVIKTSGNPNGDKIFEEFAKGLEGKVIFMDAETWLSHIQQAYADALAILMQRNTILERRKKTISKLESIVTERYLDISKIKEVVLSSRDDQSKLADYIKEYSSKSDKTFDRVQTESEIKSLLNGEIAALKEKGDKIVISMVPTAGDPSSRGSLEGIANMPPAPAISTTQILLKLAEKMDIEIIHAFPLEFSVGQHCGPNASSIIHMSSDPKKAKDLADILCFRPHSATDTRMDGKLETFEEIVAKVEKMSSDPAFQLSNDSHTHKRLALQCLYTLHCHPIGGENIEELYDVSGWDRLTEEMQQTGRNLVQLAVLGPLVGTEGFHKYLETIPPHSSSQAKE